MNDIRREKERQKSQGHENRQSMIYDCFTFFNELDLLEIRLNILDEAVDRFVLVESTRTFTNQPKTLYFEENKDRFARFLPKITYVVVNDFPENTSPWFMESHQRNAIERGLIDCREDDVILISDLDEIPDPRAIRQHRNEPGIMIFEQLMHYYYLNHINIRRPVWPGTRMLSHADFRHGLDDVDNYGRCNPEELNRGTTANKIRIHTKGTRIPRAGWHFTFLGGVEAIRKKLQSFSHQELNFEKYTDLKNIERRMQRAFESHQLLGVELDENYPAYLRENRERYAEYIGPLTPPDVARRVRRMAPLLCRVDQISRFAAKMLVCLIPVKSWRKRARIFFADKVFGNIR